MSHSNGSYQCTGAEKNHVNVIQAVNSLNIVHYKIVNTENNPLKTDSI